MNITTNSGIRTTSMMVIYLIIIITITIEAHLEAEPQVSIRDESWLNHRPLVVAPKWGE